MLSAIADFGASGSAFQTTGSISSGSNLLTVASVGTGSDAFSVGQAINVVGAGTPKPEIQKLTLFKGATTAANVSVTLNDVTVNIPLLTTDNTAALVAAKIRAGTYTGWTVSGSGPDVIWTAGTNGKRAGDYSYYYEAADAAGAIFSTQKGESPANLRTTISSISGNVLTLASNAGVSVSGATVEHDDTAALQAYIDGGGYFIDPGVYRVRKLRFKSGMKFHGAGRYYFTPGGTEIRPETNSPEPYLVDIPNDAVTYWSVKDVFFNGANYPGGPPINTGQGCMHFYAQPLSGSPYHGGMWYGEIDNVLIRAFEAEAIWFRGGRKGFYLPHQFINVQDVGIFNRSLTESRAVKLTGQCGQFNFGGTCEFAGEPGQGGGGIVMEIGPEYRTTADLINQVNAVGDRSAYAINFENTSLGTTERVLVATAVDTISLDSCYAEGVVRSIWNRGGIMSIKRTKFANAGATYPTPDGFGYCIQNTGGGKLYLGENYYIGLFDYSIKNYDGYVYHTAPSLSDKFMGSTIQSAATSTLVTGLSETVWLSRGANISAIQSDLPVGKTITFIVAPGSTATFVSNPPKLVIPGKPGNTSYPSVPGTLWTVPGGHAATFRRFDVGYIWVLVASTI